MIRLKLPNGRTFRTDGTLEPSLKDIYQMKLMAYFDQHAGIQALPEFRVAIQAIKKEYADLISKENPV